MIHLKKHIVAMLILKNPIRYRIGRFAAFLIIMQLLVGCGLVKYYQYPRQFETSVAAFEDDKGYFPDSTFVTESYDAPFFDVYDAVETSFSHWKIKIEKKTPQGVFYAKESFEHAFHRLNSYYYGDNTGVYFYKCIVERVSEIKTKVTLVHKQQTACEVLESTPLAAILTFGLTEIMKTPDTKDIRECKNTPSYVTWGENRRVLDQILEGISLSASEIFDLFIE